VNVDRLVVARDAPVASPSAAAGQGEDDEQRGREQTAVPAGRARQVAQAGSRAQRTTPFVPVGKTGAAPSVCRVRVGAP
jgi:hypothetical protein